MKNMVAVRRLVRFITKPHDDEEMTMHRSRSSGSRITMSDADVRTMSPVRGKKTPPRMK